MILSPSDTSAHLPALLFFHSRPGTQRIGHVTVRPGQQKHFRLQRIRGGPKPRPDWNRDYYGKPVLVADILIDQKVHTSQYEPLGMLLLKRGPASKPLGR